MNPQPRKPAHYAYAQVVAIVIGVDALVWIVFAIAK